MIESLNNTLVPVSPYFIFTIGIMFHWMDIFFTYKLINLGREKYENPEELEYNYYKWFMKKFGLEKGVIISGIISTSIALPIMVLAYWYYIPLAYFAVGMCFTMAYVNYVTYVSQDDLDKKLIFKDIKGS